MYPSFMLRNLNKTPYHLVETSPHATLITGALFTSASFFFGGAYGIETVAINGVILTASILAYWLRDTSIETIEEGHRTITVQTGIYLGFLLFVVSEISLFFSIFWAYFH